MSREFHYVSLEFRVTSPKRVASEITEILFIYFIYNNVPQDSKTKRYLNDLHLKKNP